MPEIEDMKREMFEEIRKNYDPQSFDDVLYIESDYGTFSINDLFPYTHTIEKKTNIKILKMAHEQIKDFTISE